MSLPRANTDSLVQMVKQPQEGTTALYVFIPKSSPGLTGLSFLICTMGIIIISTSHDWCLLFISESLKHLVPNIIQWICAEWINEVYRLNEMAHFHSTRQTLDSMVAAWQGILKSWKTQSFYFLAVQHGPWNLSSRPGVEPAILAMESSQT